MKTLSRPYQAVIFVAIGIVAILSFRLFAQPLPEPTEPPASDATFLLKVKNVTPLKNDAAHFQNVLTHLKTQIYDVVIHKDDGTQQHLVHPTAKLDIKTDKVTVSKVVNDGQTGGLTHMTGMTRMIASKDLSDINAVLSELQ